MERQSPRMAMDTTPAGVRSGRAADLEALARINSADMLHALGLGGVRRGRALLELFCRPPARRLARLVLAYDDLVGQAGLQVGGAWALGRFVRRAVVAGQEMVPRDGPLLLAANHPGLYDTIALFAATPRADLRVLAADRPFLRALPHTTRRLITVTEAPAARMGALRTAARHLRAGGAVLTFPGGRIEPDPAVLPGAVAALGAWSASLDLFARLVPDLIVAPVIVSGVLAPDALRHPLTRLRRGEDQRQLCAAMLQVIAPALHRGSVRVAFGPPIRAAAGGSLSAAVTGAARRLIESVMEG